MSGVRMFVAGFADAFDMQMRNTVTGERRNHTEYANCGMDAVGQAHATFDRESGDRSWCCDSLVRRSA